MTLALLLAAALAAPPADTASRPPGASPPAALASRVAEAVAERWAVPAEAVRLEWPAAATDSLDAGAPLRLLGTGTGGWWTVSLGARGAGKPPARLRIRAGTEARAAVAAREIVRGASLEEADVRVEPATTWGPPQPAGGEAPGPGWTARRGIAAGEVLREPAVGPPLLVRAGDETEVVWSGGGVELKVRGTALGSASRGERVSVRIDNRRRLEGVAEGPARVRIR